MPAVNPQILRWARETAGLSLAEAAKKLEINAARGKSPESRLEDLEDGRVEPTRPLLLRMAKQYRRPLILFYLRQPPTRGQRGQDFRTLPEGRLPSEDAILDALIRDIHARQELVREALIDELPDLRRGYVSSLPTRTSISELVRAVNETIPFSVASFRSQRGPQEAFAYLRERVESIGCFVILAGNLGSHHTAIDVEVFRGLALADPVAPFVVINDQDAPQAWSFTLLHEFCHLLLGQTGISGFQSSQPVERLCNEAASEILVPESDLERLVLASRETAQITGQLIEWAKGLKVSAAMLAYRLHLRGRLSREGWEAVTNRLRETWLEAQGRQGLRRQQETGGPNYYVLRRHRLGRGLVDTVKRLAASERLSTTKAAKVLGVKPKQVARTLDGGSRAA